MNQQPQPMQIIQRLQQLIQGHDLDLLIAPEAMFGGYAHSNKASAWAAAYPKDHPVFDEIANWVTITGTDLIIGVLLKTDQIVENAAIHFKSNGDRFIYIKSTPIHLGVDRFCTVGSTPFGATEVKGFKVAIVICYDVTYPLATFRAGLWGADLIAVPTNWPLASTHTTADFTVRSRAKETFSYLAAANKTGLEGDTGYCGLSCIVDPMGGWIQRAGHKIINGIAVSSGAQEEELLTATLSKSSTQKYHQFNEDYRIALEDVNLALFDFSQPHQGI